MTLDGTEIPRRETLLLAAVLVAGLSFVAAAQISTPNDIAKGAPSGTEFWVENIETLNQRFNAWVVN